MEVSRPRPRRGRAKETFEESAEDVLRSAAQAARAALGRPEDPHRSSAARRALGKSLVRRVCVQGPGAGALSSLSSLDTLVCCPSSLFSIKLPTKEAQKRVTTTTTTKRSIHEASTPDVLSGGPPWSGLYGPVLWLILFINLAARSWKEMFRDNLCT